MRWNRQTDATGTELAADSRETMPGLERARASLGGHGPAAWTRKQGVGAAAVGSGAIGTMAVGSLALGALAIGAVAVGAFAIGRLSVGRARIGTAEIGRLRIGALEIDEIVPPVRRRHTRRGDAA